MKLMMGLMLSIVMGNAVCAQETAEQVWEKVVDSHLNNPHMEETDIVEEVIARTEP